MGLPVYFATVVASDVATRDVYYARDEAHLLAERTRIQREIDAPLSWPCPHLNAQQQPSHDEAHKSQCWQQQTEWKWGLGRAIGEAIVPALDTIGARGTLDPVDLHAVHMWTADEDRKWYRSYLGKDYVEVRDVLVVLPFDHKTAGSVPGTNQITLSSPAGDWREHELYPYGYGLHPNQIAHHVAAAIAAKYPDSGLRQPDPVQDPSWWVWDTPARGADGRPAARVFVTVAAGGKWFGAYPPMPANPEHPEWTNTSICFYGYEPFMYRKLTGLRDPYCAIWDNVEPTHAGGESHERGHVMNYWNHPRDLLPGLPESERLHSFNGWPLGGNWLKPWQIDQLFTNSVDFLVDAPKPNALELAVDGATVTPTINLHPYPAAHALEYRHGGGVTIDRGVAPVTLAPGVVDARLLGGYQMHEDPRDELGRAQAVIEATTPGPTPEPTPDPITVTPSPIVLNLRTKPTQLVTASRAAIFTITGRAAWVETRSSTTCEVGGVKQGGATLVARPVDGAPTVSVAVNVKRR